MLFADHLVVVRGGGDLATGVIARLHRAGFPIVVLELPEPLTVRRTVAVSTAISDGAVKVEDLAAERADTAEQAVELAGSGVVAVMVSPRLLDFSAEVVVDARLAKRNIDTAKHQAPLVVGLGPGFTAGIDCDVVIETKRGHGLGKAIWDGPAKPDTGVPGSVGGETASRVLRSEADGAVQWTVGIGELVEAGQVIGSVGASAVSAAVSGVVRGLLAPGFHAATGVKIGDVDPRSDAAACWEISDKALAVGGGVLEAVLAHLNRSS